VNDPRFPDSFLPPRPGSDLVAWARGEAARLPLPVLACLDPFTVRDRIARYEGDQQQHSDEGATAAGLLLRAVLDRAVAWQAQRTVPLADPERGPERAKGGGAR
jgi:hypothetical protein